MPTPRALLIHYPERFEAEEALALTDAAGYEIAGTLTQRYLSRSKFGVGEGKAEEAADMVRERTIDVIVFDSSLNAAQSYNLAKLCKVEVKDREKLILEIFAKRATTAEAKLQVELAELSYELPRAREKVKRAKLGEQPGFFGLGKYQVDVYIRMMKRRMATLKAKVAEVRDRREIFRYRREKTGRQTVAITGYTGAGKTTLFNRLTGETKEVDAGVFTTLSPTTRGVDLGRKRILFSDTVGFINRLPTYMIEAFKSTLEEVSFSDLALLLVDAGTPVERLEVNYMSCVTTLAELDVPESRILKVVNKVDLLAPEELEDKMQRLGIKDAVSVSARTGAGVPELLQRVSARLEGSGAG
ncbi:MAG TPA: GTPase HflX [Nitrososphaerales archaeon]|nr:GTPase HflX [Nitrososphaerales archaeon]